MGKLAIPAFVRRLDFRYFTRIGLALVVTAAAIAYVYAGARNAWDFETYYYAGKAYRLGMNPYDLGDLSKVAARTVALPFIYPPITLAVFAPLSALPLQTAVTTWLGIKAGLLLFLMWNWLRLLRPSDPLLLLASALLGFDLAILWDLRTGNVALVEATILWLGLTSYIRGRLFLTTHLIALASIFKLLPLLLFALPLMCPAATRKRLMLAGVGLSAYATMVIFPLHLSREWIYALGHSADPRPVGTINPSALGLSDWLVGALELSPSLAPSLAIGLYALYCAVLLIGSVGAVLRTFKMDSRLDQVVVIVLLWLLVLPRLMIYSYTMAVLPVLYVVMTRVRSQFWRWVVVSAVGLEGVIRLLPGQPPSVLGPLSYLIVLGALVLFVRVPPRMLTDHTQAEPRDLTPETGQI